MLERNTFPGRDPTGSIPAGGKRHHVPGELLEARAAECAANMVWLPGIKSSPHLVQRIEKLNQKLPEVLAALESGTAFDGIAIGRRWQCENTAPLRSALASLADAKAAWTRGVYVRYSGQVLPRVLVIAEDLLASLDYSFGDSEFSVYLQAMQRTVVLRLDELRAIPQALQCVLLEHLVGLSDLNSDSPAAIESCIRSLREIDQAPWQELLEPLILFDAVLRNDPAGAYARMDRESQEMYRTAVVNLAKHSGRSELEIAELALSLAREALQSGDDDPVLAQRRAHVGYYLIDEGRDALRRDTHAWSPLHERCRSFLHRYPDEFYLGAIEALTLAMVVAALRWQDINSLWAAFFAALVLLLPCSESAEQIINYLTSSFLTPRILPKLDFRKGIPRNCTTMVVVPTLLLSEDQVRQLSRDLEVSYLANMSANLHFALLTDLADSEEQPRNEHPLVELCGQLIRKLNEKYAGNGAGSFAMFHRHPVYSPREGVWMGWERKRGKLLDFNKLILGEYDSFPDKAGDWSMLPQVRYVLTIDADTALPRGSAQRLIGTLAHPLCQAVVDHRNVVTQGFGILQPRVAVSIGSAAQSRLASIYSGPTGFDIYTHATSDVYQDLYGEGTFVGKGLYDVRIMHRVLDQRFPRNAILSHDLLEGAYVRAGLVSDIEVVDGYPSHYSTYARRKHRWVRGDWQIVPWLFSRVPDEEGSRVENPIPLISRWKIADNLRRSMVGPATLILFIAGWIALPGSPIYWTVLTLAILFAPPAFNFAVAAGRAAFARSFAQARDACTSLGTALTSVFLFLTFLVHDALVSLDAAVRSTYRRAITRERLLEWETAAEAELESGKRTSIDLYMALTTVIAIAIGVLLLLVRPSAFRVALPILLLWACCRGIEAWVDRPLHRESTEVSAEDQLFLRLAALRTWRYFAEFCSARHHWLLPDNVQEEPKNIAPRISPTNLGFLLNARQVACEFGYLTVPEFVERTQRTLGSMSQLQRHRGHFLNWYDTRSLLPEHPYFVSSVDSGNLAASLIALKVGCTALLEKPLLSASLLEGYLDHLRLLAASNSLPSSELNTFLIEQEIAKQKNLPWLERLASIVSTPVSAPYIQIDSARGSGWFATQLHERIKQTRKIFADYMPWLLPEFETLRRSLGIAAGDESGPSLSQLPSFVQHLQTTLSQDAASKNDAWNTTDGERLLALLPDAIERASSLARDLRAIAAQAERLVAEMDFRFLLERRRKLLSVGYHVDTNSLDAACYDLLASEARIAVFLAIAKGDVPQDTWLRLGRSHVPVQGGFPALISWAGTMFEYLMPAIWMRSPGGTLLQRSMESAVRAQMAYADANQIPWGISESSYSELDDSGIYRYAAMGVPELALREAAPERLVVAPYAGAMALAVAPADAIGNLRRMAELGWMGACGFYESADFGEATNLPVEDARLVKAWMAHHQGMILLSIGNFLCGNIVQQWFHGDAQVRATEILLHERPVIHNVRTRSRRDGRPVRGQQGGSDIAIAS
jgi:cyclic beta-1,2-glucan synthetase